MRIISGFARGRKLSTPPANEKSIRPTSDRAREALFNIIGGQLQDSLVLDLFAGTGALGIEALSRGAGFVVLVDDEPLALRLIKKNVLQCLRNYTGNAEIRVIKHDLHTNLPVNKLPEETREGFNIIFADPPYSKTFSLNVLHSVNNGGLLKADGILIIEERHDVELPDKLSHLQCIDQRTYGETRFFLYSRNIL